MPIQKVIYDYNHEISQKLAGNKQTVKEFYQGTKICKNPLHKHIIANGADCER